MAWSQKVVCVTGVGKLGGVGIACVKEFASRGANVIALARTPRSEVETELARIGESSNVYVQPFYGDLSFEDTPPKLAEFIGSNFKRLDCLVNNAGITKIIPYPKLEDVSRDDFNQIFQANVYAPFFLMQSLAPFLRSEKGSIVNVGSTAGFSGKGSSIPYASSKGALHCLTLALSHALAPDVRVNAVCPGYIESSWWDPNMDPEKHKKMRTMMEDISLIKKVCYPDDVAHLVASVAENQMLSGNLIPLDGGMLINSGLKMN